MGSATWRAFRTGAICCTAAAALTGCGLPQPERIAVVSKAMAQSLPNEFANLSFSIPVVGEGLQPVLVFSGKSSTLVAQDGPKLSRDYGILDTPYEVLETRVLAATKNGRYFTFTYRSLLNEPNAPDLLRQPCLKNKCRRIKDAKPVTREDAMKWYFESDDYSPARFEQLFGEPGPVKKVDA